MATETETDIWVNGMLIQIARDLELIKDRLGIITDAEGDTRYVPGSLLPPDQSASSDPGAANRPNGLPASEPTACDAQYVSWLAPRRDPDCPACDTDTHLCPGCGKRLPHGEYACESC